MEFAGQYVLNDIENVMEEIYQEEIDDGIAGCAKEQADVWNMEAKEQGNDTEFVSKLLALLKNVDENKANEKAKKDRQGAMGTTTRMQPRFQKGKKAQYDNLVSDRIRQERDIKLKQKNASIDFSFLSVPTVDVKDICENTPKWLISDNGNVDPVIIDNENTIIIDIGTDMTNCGFGGDDAPRAVFPSIVGRPRHQGVMVGMGQKDSYIGDEAQSKRGILTMKYPVERGHVTNWDDLEKILHHSFYNELRVCPEETVVIVSQPTDVSTASQQKLRQILFETFNTPAIQLVPAPVLSLIGEGKITGLVINLGESTRIDCVYNGLVIKDSSQRVDVGGRDLTDYLMKIMTEKGYSFTTTAERDIIKDIKHKLSYVAENFDEEMKKSSNSSDLEKSYELPDGQVITIDSERFRLVEALFCPAYLGLESHGLIDSILRSIHNSPPELRKLLLENIIIVGGGSRIPGLQERIAKDLAPYLPSLMKCKIKCCGKYTEFIGGSVLSTLDAFSSMLMTNNTYNEYGPEGDNKISFTTNSYELEKKIASLNLNLGHNKDDSFSKQQQQQQQLEAEKKAKEEQERKRKEEEEEKAKEKKEEEREAKEKQKKKEEASSVVMTQACADTNSICLHLGQIIEQTVHDKLADVESNAVKCSGCSSILTSLSQVDAQSEVWTCEFCQKENENIFSDFIPKENSFIYRNPANVYTDEKNDQSMADAAIGTSLKTHHGAGAMIVFCVDISGSMNTTAGYKKTRLGCIKSAVMAQIKEICRTQPDCVPVLLTFGSSLEVYTNPHGYNSFTTISNCERLSIQNLVQEGTNLGGKCNFRASDVSESLCNAVNKLATKGMTALGPALAVAVGITSKNPGSTILCCTDGQANVGVGSTNLKDGFYEKIANIAKSKGTEICVMTTEGEDCSMENLGTAADITGGRVEIVNPLNLEKEVKSMLQKSTIATNVKAKIIGGEEITFEKNKSLNLDIGNVNKDTDVTLAFDVAIRDLQKVRKETMFQLELTYKTPDGNSYKKVITKSMSINSCRAEVEENNVKTDIVGLQAIHTSARLAQEGKYLDARVNLVSTQRLLQRCMKTETNQQDYLSFIVQAEKLDQFMRETQAQEKFFGADSRDDEAARNMYQMKTLPAKLFRSRS